MIIVEVIKVTAVQTSQTLCEKCFGVCQNELFMLMRSNGLVARVRLWQQDAEIGDGVVAASHAHWLRR